MLNYHTYTSRRVRFSRRNRRRNDNLEQLAQAIFNKWILSCHDIKSIKELADNILDYTPNTNNKVILLNSSDVTEGEFAVLPYSDNSDLKGQFKKRFRKGDVLYSEIRPRNRHYAYCYFNADKYIASTRLIILRSNKDLITSSTILYQYLKMKEVFDEFVLKTESRSGTFPQGNYQDLSSTIVPYSPDQKILADHLDSLYERIWANQEENKKLEQTRDTLLPKLMSGELKINDLKS